MAIHPDQIVSRAQAAFAQSNTNPSHNTYLWQDEAWTLAEARHAASKSPLYGLPVSVKDCFDLAGAPTSLGTKFYRKHNGTAAHDSWLVERLRAAGAVIMGKTHLHPLAYGITGENAEFGDCLQRHPHSVVRFALQFEHFAIRIQHRQHDRGGRDCR